MMIPIGMGQTVATPTMPTLPANTCASGQTYIPPGGTMGPQYNNQITPTGACIDNLTSPVPAAANTPATSPFMVGLEAWTAPSTALSTLGTCFGSPSTCFTSTNMPVLAGLLLPPVALVAALFMMSSKGSRR